MHRRAFSWPVRTNSKEDVDMRWTAISASRLIEKLDPEHSPSTGDGDLYFGQGASSACPGTETTRHRTSRHNETQSQKNSRKLRHTGTHPPTCLAVLRSQNNVLGNSTWPPVALCSLTAVNEQGLPSKQEVRWVCSPVLAFPPAHLIWGVLRPAPT